MNGRGMIELVITSIGFLAGIIDVTLSSIAIAIGLITGILAVITSLPPVSSEKSKGNQVVKVKEEPTNEPHSESF